MSKRAPLALLGALGLLVGSFGGAAQTLTAENQTLLQNLERVHDLTPDQMASVRRIFEASGVLSQGNPAISEHPATPAQCEEELSKKHIGYANPTFERICGAKYMAPLYDPAKDRAENAKVCIDQFEFPDIPCAYPVVWVRAREAAELCEAIGKRLCDAHEWEGACQGQLTPPDYRFDLIHGLAPNAAISRMRAIHNQAHQVDKRWSYGPDYERGTCAAASHKTPGCAGGGWSKCGSNTYPTGYFPACHSPLEVYDLNGNVAEHMNLPLNQKEMASRGSRDLGYTEMKGSWFIFDSYRAHEDWCRWRAPFWHASRVMDVRSHANYHLGFRCCKTLKDSWAEQ